MLGERAPFDTGAGDVTVEQSSAGMSLQAVVFCYCSLPLGKLFCSPCEGPQPSAHQHLLENFETATVLSPDSQIIWTNGSIVGSSCVLKYHISAGLRTMEYKHWPGSITHGINFSASTSSPNHHFSARPGGSVGQSRRGFHPRSRCTAV